jgi:hypothetical protein
VSGTADAEAAKQIVMSLLNCILAIILRIACVGVKFGEKMDPSSWALVWLICYDRIQLLGRVAALDDNLRNMSQPLPASL